jgi:hypothetical protein
MSTSVTDSSNTPALMTPLNDLVPILIKTNNLKEGWYALSTTFSISVVSGPLPGATNSELNFPTALCQVTEVGIQRVPPNTPFAVDASTLS